MAGRGHTFLKRQKEIARKEKQREKAERRAQRKAASQNEPAGDAGVLTDASGVPPEAEHGRTEAGGTSE